MFKHTSGNHISVKRVDANAVNSSTFVGSLYTKTTSNDVVGVFKITLAVPNVNARDFCGVRNCMRLSGKF